MSSSRQRIYDHHGRDTRLAKVPAALGGVVGGDTPIFDSGRSVVVQRVTHAPQNRTTPYGFKADKPSGTRVPFHEPDPDRFTKSEALRAKLAAEEQRKKETRDAGPSENWAPGYLKPAPSPGLKPIVHPRALDIPVPKGEYSLPPEGRRNIMAVRGDKVLLFASSLAAERCFTGRDKATGTLVRDALARPQRGNIAYGWEWSRLAPSPRGASRK